MLNVIIKNKCICFSTQWLVFPVLSFLFVDVLGLEVGAGTPEGGGGEEQEDEKCT